MGTVNGRPRNGHDHEAHQATPHPAIIALPADTRAIWPPADDAWPATTPNEYDLERPRLDAEIAAARARTAAARQRRAERDAELNRALRNEIVESQEHVAQMEREHEVAIAAVLEAAHAEAARILAESRQQLSDAAVARANGPAVGA